MYINPQAIDISERKLITTNMTKGGYNIQYWGNQLTTFALRGETGDGGIEALNVLHDVYRSEQIALQDILQSAGVNSKRRQSLAQLACSVTMWYQGEGHRGFFTEMNYGEKAANGSISYTINFTSVEKIGRRKNFLLHHRRPWSTMDTPSFPDNKMIIGGGYGTNFKKGELNMPQVREDV
jgi:hypothetical protein